MLFLRGLADAGIVVERHDAESVGRPHRKTVDGSPRTQRRGLCGRLEPRRAKGGQRRQGQGDPDLAELDLLSIDFSRSTEYK